MVGWDTSNGPVRSQTQASPPSWEAISESSRSRTGSDRALNIFARSAAASSPSGSRTIGEQHATASSWPSTGSSRFDMHLC